jgi:hypothetical protein
MPGRESGILIPDMAASSEILAIRLSNGYRRCNRERQGFPSLHLLSGIYS